jgi:hypothetical protein
MYELKASAGPRFRAARPHEIGAGTGLTMTMLKPPAASAQQAIVPPTAGLEEAPKQNVQSWPDIRESHQVASTTQTGYTVSTGPGWVNHCGPAPLCACPSTSTVRAPRYALRDHTG